MTGRDGIASISNHDQPRMVSRFGDDSPLWRVKSAKMLATMLHTMQGTPYIYQGEEIGMTNVAFPSIEDYEDVEIRNWVKEERERGALRDNELLKRIHYRGRDNARTPMQWTAGKGAGFTSGTPCLGLNPNYAEINAEAALADPDSIFRYYQTLIALRKRKNELVYAGSFEDLCPRNEFVYAYRTLKAETFTNAQPESDEAF